MRFHRSKLPAAKRAVSPAITPVRPLGTLTPKIVHERQGPCSQPGRQANLDARRHSAFASRRARLVLVGRNRQRLADLSQGLRAGADNAIATFADVADSASVNDYFAKAAAFSAMSTLSSTTPALRAWLRRGARIGPDVRAPAALGEIADHSDCDQPLAGAFRSCDRRCRKTTIRLRTAIQSIRGCAIGSARGNVGLDESEKRLLICLVASDRPRDGSQRDSFLAGIAATQRRCVLPGFQIRDIAKIEHS